MLIAITVKKFGQFIELVLTTLLIYIIIAIPDCFLWIDRSNSWYILITNITGVIIAYFGYRYLAQKTDTIFESINFKKIGFVIITLIMTIIIIDYLLPVLVGQGQGSGANQKAIEDIINQAGLPALLFKFNIVFIGPTLEEVFFRGIMFEEARPLGKYVQFIWPTLTFAAVHSPGTVDQWATYLTAGVSLMFVKIVTKKLQYAILFHSLHNLIVLF